MLSDAPTFYVKTEGHIRFIVDSKYKNNRLRDKRGLKEIAYDIACNLYN